MTCEKFFHQSLKQYTYLVLDIKAIGGKAQNDGSFAHRLVPQEHNLVFHLHCRVACRLTGYRFGHLCHYLLLVSLGSIAPLNFSLEDLL